MREGGASSIVTYVHRMMGVKHARQVREEETHAGLSPGSCHDARAVRSLLKA
jgi:hypothetical protein